MADEAPGATLDVAIVGAGPAGTSAVMALAGSGLSVKVFERLDDGPHSRYHSICGEAVSDRMFERLGWAPSSVVKRVDTISITNGDVRVDVPVRGAIVDRPAMLAEMRARCDAGFVRAGVESVRADGEGYVLRLRDGSEVRCRWLIGADGSRSAVRRDIFRSGPTNRRAIVNCIAEGSEDALTFKVGGPFSGGYAWRFPSKPGTVSVGFPVGDAKPRDVEGVISWGSRDLPYGAMDTVVDGRCMLIGDAACLANPICYGGIGAALLSGRRAAEAVLSGRPQRYQRWVSHDIMFDRHFMEAHRQFSDWDDEEIAEAIEPFRNGYSVWRGAGHAITHPRRFNVLLATFIAFKVGW